jgi:pimeloyl-ACP methyl ester carboxylesterase
MSETGGSLTGVNYEIVGDGPPVLLLHGWAGCIASMSPIREMLRDQYTVLSIDLPGFGLSRKPTERWGSDEYARRIGQMLVGLDKSRLLAIIGHSFGGKVAVHMVLQGQVQADALVLIGTPGARLPLTKKAQRRVAFVKSAKRLAHCMPRPFESAVARRLSRLGSDDYRNAGDMRDTLVCVVNEDLKPLLPGIGVPTLLLWGERDEAAPLEIGRIMESSIRGSGLVVFSKSGHFPYIDEPAAFAAVTRSFLASTREKRDE